MHDPLRARANLLLILGALMLLTFPGGLVVGLMVGSEWGPYEGLASGSMVSASALAVLMLVLRVVRQRQKRIKSVAAAPTRVAALVPSGHETTVTARLVRDDGLDLGEQLLQPPAKVVKLVGLGAKLMVHWHPEYPDDALVDWDEAAARMRTAQPAVARIAEILHSHWGDRGATFRARLVRNDGVPIGEHSLTPPPHLAELIRVEEKLWVRWHPDFPQHIDVAWEESAELLSHGGYRT